MDKVFTMYTPNLLHQDRTSEDIIRQSLIYTAKASESALFSWLYQFLRTSFWVIQPAASQIASNPGKLRSNTQAAQHCWDPKHIDRLTIDDTGTHIMQ